MILHGVARTRSISLWLSAWLAVGCGSSSKNASIVITAPEKDQVLTSKDDLNKTREGLQYTVTATASEVAAGTTVILQIENQQEAAITQVGKDGSIVFDSANLPAGTHSLVVSTMSGGVRSAADWQYTYRALIIDDPTGSVPLGQLDDEDKDKDGIQISVSVSAPGVDLSSNVTLQVDGSQVGEAQNPSADGKLVFKGVDLSDGDHTLQAFSNGLESDIRKVTVSSICASGGFVMPMPPEGDEPLKLGGGDKCPSDGEPFKTDFWFATDAGENRDVDLYVNGVLYAREKVQASTVKFTDVVLDRYNTANEVSVVVQGAQGVTCKAIPYPVEIRLDCAGVDCSISGPQPVAGVNADGEDVQYLNASQRGKDGFDFQVHTDAESIGQPVKLIIDGRDLDAPTADPSGSDPDVKATFTGIALSDGPHTIQALCEHKSGTRGFSRSFNWIVDTQACGVDITKPAADAAITPNADADTSRDKLQLAVETNVTGDDCTAARAATCKAADGIKGDVGFAMWNGTNPLKSTVTLGDEASQSICVEVRDRAGNVGKDSVDITRRAEDSKLLIETPANNAKYNSVGGGDFIKDTDTSSEDVCNANFDVACTDIDADIQLRRNDANGTVIATQKCAAKGGSDPALPNGYTGRARFTNVAFLENGADSAKVLATLGTGAQAVKSATITLNGDCEAPKLAFVGNSCGPFSVANPAEVVNNQTVIATDSTNQSSHATLNVTVGTTSSTKEAELASGQYTFTGVNYAAAGTAVTLEVTATDAFNNVGTVSCKVGIAYGSGITDVALPTDPRSGTVKLTWAAPAGNYDRYELRCDTTPLDIETTTDTGDRNDWWQDARTIALPGTVTPPATTADVGFRIGESLHCMIRALGAGSTISPIVSTTNVQLQFRTQTFAPESHPDYTGAGPYAGHDIAAIGDVNGDSIDDVLVGGWGQAYLVFGSSEGWDGTPDVRFLGGVDSYFADSVVGLGDFNGDGRNDFAIGDFSWPDVTAYRGRVLVYFGRASNQPWPTTVDTRTACNADICFESTGEHSFGSSISSAGNFDGAGPRDLAVGAVAYPNPTDLFGRIYVILGGDLTAGRSRNGDGFFGLALNVDGGTPPKGFVVNGVAGDTALLGQSIASIGAFDAASGDDIVVTALGGGPTSEQGKVFLLPGRAHTGSGLTDIALNTLTLIDSGDANSFGFTVVALGNVYDLAGGSKPGAIDIAIVEGTRAAYYVYLGDSDFDRGDRLTVSAQTSAPNLNLGSSVCTGTGGRGDLDGDGFADLCSGSALNPTPVAPATPAAPGVANLWYADTLKSKLRSRGVTTAAALVLPGPTSAVSSDYPAKTVEYVGDVNGDGKPDVAIGSYGANSNAGEFSILY